MSVNVRIAHPIDVYGVPRRVGALVLVDNDLAAQLINAGYAVPSFGPIIDDSLGMIAYAENGSNSPTVVAPTTGLGVAVPIAGCLVVVPPTEHDVWLSWGCRVGNFGTTFSPASRGMTLSVVYEVTDNVAVAADAGLSHQSYGTNYISNNMAEHHGEHHVGPVTSIRMFQLYLNVSAETGTLGASSANVNGPGRSWISAEAR